MEQENRSNDDISYFNQLPKELKEVILLDLNLNIVEVLKIQSTSKEWRELAWRCLTDLDTNLLRDLVLIDGAQRTNVLTKVISRLNIGVLRRLIMDANRSSVYSQIYNVIQKCHSLEYLADSGYQSPWVLEYTDSLKNLSEISFVRELGLSNIDLDQLRCRANVTIPGYYTAGQDNKETPITPKLNFSHVEKGEWVQKEPIKFNKKCHRGGMIGDELVVIGATDGTLTFFKLDTTNVENATLVIHSSNNIHKGSINEIWNEQSQHTYVASSDGIVTAWDPSPEGPVLVQTLEFPEEILFVCDSPAKHILAASSHKLFIADIETAKIIKTEQVEETITGLFGNTQRVLVGTTKRFYTSYGSDATNGVMKPNNFTEALTPNFWVTPDASFISVVLPNEVQCIDLASGGTFKRYPNPNSAKFDSRSGVLKFNPVRYWFSVSTGTNIVTYDLEPSDNAIISSVSPRISRSDIDAGNFPTCHSLWWDTKGEVLFGLYSNNTLCWWHLPRLTKERIDAAIQQEKQKLEEQQAKEKKQEEQQALVVPPGTATDNDDGNSKTSEPDTNAIK